MQPSDWLASYRAGACAEVWSAMTELGPNVRDANLLDHAERSSPRRCRADSGPVRRRRAGEFFVSYLRATFESGGFRGNVGGDEERSWTVPPDLELKRTLAVGLQPI